MRKNRSYKPQQKAQAVLQVLNGTKSAAQVCRDLHINENLLSRWKQQLLTHAALVFERESEAAEKDEQIAELQRLVGRLTVELEVAKKASQFASYRISKNGKRSPCCQRIIPSKSSVKSSGCRAVPIITWRSSARRRS